MNGLARTLGALTAAIGWTLIAGALVAAPRWSFAGHLAALGGWALATALVFVCIAWNEMATRKEIARNEAMQARFRADDQRWRLRAEELRQEQSKAKEE